MQRTLYIGAENADVWTQAEKTAEKQGVSLSAFVTSALITKLSEKQNPLTLARALVASLAGSKG
jgi:uncharacterized membrane protein YjjP (DUF1212 family)